MVNREAPHGGLNPVVALAMFLLVIGIADLARPASHPNRAGHTIASIAIVLAAGLAIATGTGIAPWFLVCTIAVAIAWILSTRGLRQQKIRPWPAFMIGVAALAILASSSFLVAGGGWLTAWYAALRIEPLQAVDFAQFALATSYFIFLLNSANFIVRMILDWSGTPVETSEMDVKGGRLIGPLERIFIFALALAGQYVTIAAVLAAKGILRYPEISESTKRTERTRPRRAASLGSRAEYVLIGSLVSWMIAFAAVPLIA